MKSNLNIITSFVSPENLNTITKELNYLPVFVIRNIANSVLIGKYSGTSIHFRDFAPSTQLYQLWRDKKIDQTQYEKLY